MTALHLYHPSQSTATALLIIDMQRVYFESPALRERQGSLVASCNQLIAAFKDRQSYLLNVQTSHERDRSTWTLSMLDDSQGYLFAGDQQVQPLDGLAVDNLPMLTKTRDSAFFATDLAQRLHTLGIEQVILAGVSTHTCIAQTAADAYAHNFRVTLARDAIATHVPTYHEPTLELLSGEYRQTVLGNQEILQGDII